MCKTIVQAIKVFVVYILRHASAQMMEASPLDEPPDCVFLQLQSFAEVKKWMHGACLFAGERWCVCFCKNKKQTKNLLCTNYLKSSEL